MRKPIPEKRNPDYLYAFSCALNLELYAADPGPQTVTIGSPGEQRTITRRDHLLDLYSRLLLLKLDADPDRLFAVAAEAERRLNEKSAQNSESDNLEVETDTLGIADTAMRIIHDAGADVDQQSRKRLLTAMNYQTSRDIFGTFLGDPSLAGPPDNMIDDLNHIDQSGHDQ
jgi:hypothetical protein